MFCSNDNAVITCLNRFELFELFELNGGNIYFTGLSDVSRLIGRHKFNTPLQWNKFFAELRGYGVLENFDFTLHFWQFLTNYVVCDDVSWWWEMFLIIDSFLFSFNVISLNLLNFDNAAFSNSMSVKIPPLFIDC